MASKILLKKSTTASSVPTAPDLDVGEVAINTEDKRLFTKDLGGSIVEVSTTPSTLDVDGNATVGGTLGVTGTTTAGTVNATTVTVSGTLTVPTPSADTDAASKGYVDTEVSSAVATVIDSSPAALDTLNELAAALGDDPNFSATITTTIGTKLPKDGSEAMSGNLDLGTNKVVNVVDPTSAQDAATKTYVDTADATKLNLSGGTMTGDITMGANAVTSTADPATDDELARKGYVDTILGSATDAATSATNAATSETNAATSATNAATSESNAATSATNAAASYDSFDDRYLGAKATAPALDNDGDALITGALYFDTSVGAMYVYDGSAWDQVAITVSDVLTVNNNLSDLQSASTALTNLGITATATELNYTDGVTSNIQTQIDNIDTDPTKGTLTKSFANGEQASITLSSAISPAPVVSVTKEVAQTGVSSKGSWDVATDGANYELHDTAYDTTLTPGPALNDANNWTYDDKSFSVSSQEAAPNGIAFNNDGTKMYIVGNGGDDVNQYSLSTAFDISTASFDSVTFSVSSQDIYPAGITFNNDGTKMYIVGSTNDTVYQYSLSTAYDLSTASYDSVSFSVTSQDTFPWGITFNNDGTKMYIVGIGNDTVYQYSLSTAYDLSTASYDSISLNVSGQDANPRHVVFNSDGTKMFLAGVGDEEINQYSLSTAFDISTASFDSVLLSTSSQDTSPVSLVFNSNFTKLFVVGNSTDTVYQYTTGQEALILGSGSFASTDVGKRIVGNGGEAILTATDGSYSVVTAFTDSSAIASGSWSMYALTFDGTDGVKIGGIKNGFKNASEWTDNNESFSVASQDTVPAGVAFNNTGTKMYVVGYGNDTVHQYTLSTAFDVTTASYDSVSFSVSSQDGTPFTVKFNPDGTKMYIVGNTNDNVFQYTLTTAFDISTALYATSFSFSSQTTTVTGLAFNNDGTKMYTLNYTTATGLQYSLSTAYDVSTASYDSVTFSFGTQDTSPRDIIFNTDGTKIYMLGNAQIDIFQYTLSTAYDISTASYDSENFSLNATQTSPLGMAVNSTGTRFYVVGNGSDAVYQYETGTAYAPTSAYHPTVTKTSGQIDTSFWTDINTMTADETLNGGEVYYAVSTDDRTTWAVIDDTDGVRNIVRDNSGTWQYNDASTYGGTTWVNATTNDELYALQEALEDGNSEFVASSFDLSIASYDSVSFDVSSEETGPISIAFNSNGTKMFILGVVGDDVNEYALSTAYNPSTASFTTNFSVASQEIAARALTFNPDGTKMYIVGSTNDTIYQYTLTTGFDLSTASYATKSFSQNADVPEGLQFNDDGTKIYVAGSSFIYEYDLSTAYDISTASYNSVNFNTGSQTTSPDDLRFNSDGTKLFVCSDTNFVFRYGLTTAYDLSTISYDSVSFDVSNESSDTKGMAFNNDGTKMYIVDLSSNSIFQYSTGTTGNLNRMNSTQLDAVTDPNHYTLGDTLDLGIILYTDSAGSIPESDGVSINYDAEALNQGAVLGTDYDYDFPDSTTVRVTSNAAQNLKIRVV